jgi:hypothetical protein
VVFEQVKVHGLPNVRDGRGANPRSVAALEAAWTVHSMGDER